MYMAAGIRHAYCQLETHVLERVEETSKINPYPTAFPYSTVWFYTSTSNKRAARPKQYTESLTRDLKLMYTRLTLVRISINL